jgi:hypothetical protein
MRAEIEDMVNRLEGLPVIMVPTVQTASEAVQRALSDVGSLLATNGPVSVVDRVHTALHGYLREVAKGAGIAIDDGASVTRIYTLLIRDHPDLQSLGDRSEDIRLVLRSASAILDAFNTLRNRSSVAHPNQLLGEDEARLVVDLAHSLFHYLSSKLG